jgi:hypothetical protein
MKRLAGSALTNLLVSPLNLDNVRPHMRYLATATNDGERGCSGRRYLTFDAICTDIRTLVSLERVLDGTRSFDGVPAEHRDVF